MRKGFTPRTLGEIEEVLRQHSGVADALVNVRDDVALGETRLVGYVVLKPDYRGHGSSEGDAVGGYGSNAYTIDVLNALSSIKRFNNQLNSNKKLFYIN